MVRNDKLYQVFSAIDEPKAMASFLTDLCTPAELDALAGRLAAAEMLVAGESYRQVAEKTGLSTATVTRVGRALKHGKGGYRLALGFGTASNKEAK